MGEGDGGADIEDSLSDSYNYPADEPTNVVATSGGPGGGRVLSMNVNISMRDGGELTGEMLESQVSEALEQALDDILSQGRSEHSTAPGDDDDEEDELDPTFIADSVEDDEEERENAGRRPNHTGM